MKNINYTKYIFMFFIAFRVFSPAYPVAFTIYHGLLSWYMVAFTIYHGILQLNVFPETNLYVIDWTLYLYTTWNEFLKQSPIWVSARLLMLLNFGDQTRTCVSGPSVYTHMHTQIYIHILYIHTYWLVYMGSRYILLICHYVFSEIWLIFFVAVIKFSVRFYHICLALVISWWYNSLK